MKLRGTKYLYFLGFCLITEMIFKRFVQKPDTFLPLPRAIILRISRFSALVFVAPITIRITNLEIIFGFA